MFQKFVGHTQIFAENKYTKFGGAVIVAHINRARVTL